MKLDCCFVDWMELDCCSADLMVLDCCFVDSTELDCCFVDSTELDCYFADWMELDCCFVDSTELDCCFVDLTESASVWDDTPTVRLWECFCTIDGSTLDDCQGQCIRQLCKDCHRRTLNPLLSDKRRILAPTVGSKSDTNDSLSHRCQADCKALSK